MYKILFIIIAGLISSASYSQNENYFGASISSIGYSERGFPDFDLSSLNLIAGQNINDNLAAEVRLGFGIRGDTINAQTLGLEEDVNVDLDLDKFMGIYLKYSLESSNSIIPYATLGYTHAKAKASVMDVSASASESDISMGLGVDISLNQKTSLNIEYMNFIDTNTITADGISVGLRTAL